MDKKPHFYFEDENDLPPGVSRIGDCIAEFFQRQAKRHLKRKPKRRKNENQRLFKDSKK